MIQIEDDILTRCQGGDKAAFRWVVQTYQCMLFSLALKMLADEEEAKDVVQDTFVRAWTAIRSYNPQQPFASWLYTIATHSLFSRIRWLSSSEANCRNTVMSSGRAATFFTALSLLRHSREAMV